eukprot:CCRYP_015036-RD/>CCRYP_015036-RD protein AED:0.48 eAED:0.71 QI:0/0/0.5/1/0/0.5/2/248/114
MALTHEALYPFLYRKRHQINFGFEKGLVIAFRTDLGSLSIEDTTSGFLPQSNKLKSHLHLCGGKHHHYELPYLQVLDASVFYEVYFKSHWRPMLSINARSRKEITPGITFSATP